jgi:hypothetical protein
MTVDHGEDPERTAVEQLVGHEAHRPDLVGGTERRPALAVAPGALALGQLGPDRQPVLTIETVNALGVDGPALSPEEYVQPR